MRCQQCDYPLWNLKTRICPECGKPFAPGEFRFVPNSVRFCCPNCEQEYYGTDASGHLVPREFDCVSCGQHIAMDEMVLRPAAGVRDDQAAADSMPWLQRGRANWFQCWWQTVWRGMIAPNRLMDALPTDAKIGEAWWYAALSLFVFLVCGASIPFAVIGVIELVTGGPDAAVVLGIAVGAPIVGTLLNLLFILIWAACTHGMLLITGGCKRTIGATIQATCYTVGPNLLMAVPCIGVYCAGYVSGIWWVVSAILAVAAVQGVHGGRAALATLAFPVTFTVLFVGAYFGLIFYGMSTAATMGPGSAFQTAVTPTDDTTPLTTALLDYANASGDWPSTPLVLVRDGQLDTMDLVAADSDTLVDEVPVGSSNLGDLEFAVQSQRQRAFESALQKHDADNMVAHRLGDFVFTYHGIDPATGDPNLWIVVQAEDPDAVYTTTFDTAHVGTLGGQTVSIPKQQLPQRIREQNELRAEHGLPALPETLDTITHDTPVVESP